MATKRYVRNSTRLASPIPTVEESGGDVLVTILRKTIEEIVAALSATRREYGWLMNHNYEILISKMMSILFENQKEYI